MKFNIVLLSFATLMFLLFTACNQESTEDKQTATATADSTQTTDADIQVIQFHSEHRCMTCRKMEKLSRQALEDYSSVPFSLVNVDKEKNESKAEQFQATGTALFLYNPETGEKKNLTEFAFMNAGDNEKFKAGLKEEIDRFVD